MPPEQFIAASAPDPSSETRQSYTGSTIPLERRTCEFNLTLAITDELSAPVNASFFIILYNYRPF